MKKILLISMVMWAALAEGSASASTFGSQWNISCAGRYFLGFSLTRDSMGGDFGGQGSLVLGNLEKAFYIPKLDPGIGFSLVFGETRKNGLWEVSYSMTPHKAFFQGKSGRAYSHLLEVNGKGYLIRKATIRPYIQLGFNLAWLHVNDAAVKGTTLYDANYLGLGVNAGLGFIVPLNPKLFLSAGGAFRFLAYLYAKGPGRARDVTNLSVNRTGPRRDVFLKAPGLRFEIRLGYVL